MNKVEYKVLNKIEVEEFINKYMPIWAKDIYKVSCISYKKSKEYLVNDHYIFKPSK